MTYRIAGLFSRIPPAVSQGTVFFAPGARAAPAERLRSSIFWPGSSNRGVRQSATSSGVKRETRRAMVLTYWIVRRDAPASDALVSGHLYVTNIEAAIQHVRGAPVPDGTASSDLEIILHRGGPRDLARTLRCRRRVAPPAPYWGGPRGGSAVS